MSRLVSVIFNCFAAMSLLCHWGVVCLCVCVCVQARGLQGFWSELQWNRERTKYLDAVPNPRYRTSHIQADWDKLVSVCVCVWVELIDGNCLNVPVVVCVYCHVCPCQTTAYFQPSHDGFACFRGPRGDHPATWITWRITQRSRSGSRWSFV